MQRGHRTSNRLTLDSVPACDQVEPGRAPESCSRHRPDDSNAHSGPLATTKTEAHVFQRKSEDESDMLLARHIPGNGIPRKTGSKRGGQWETRNTSWIGVFNPVEDAKLRVKVADKRGRPAPSHFRSDSCTCKAAFRHVKVRRRSYCESAMKFLVTTRTL